MRVLNDDIFRRILCLCAVMLAVGPMARAEAP